MGDLAGDFPEETAHPATITKGFWIATTEVTQQQWKAVMGPEEIHPDKPSPFWGRASDYPKVSISFYDVQRFLKKLEQLSPGNRFRLPTEAEWEYACRAGTQTPFAFGQVISDSAVCFNAGLVSPYTIPGKTPSHPESVGSYPPNAWGLYDMHGNVWEWVADWYAPYPNDSLSDPRGPEDGHYKIIRGGSWFFGGESARSSKRKTHRPEHWGFSIGFRIVREPG